MPGFPADVLRAAYGLSYESLMSLLATLDDEGAREAIESDLIDKGLRLRWVGSDSLAWHELYAVIKNLGHGTAFHRYHNPEHQEWDIYAMLLADVVDTLRAANWQRANDRKSNYPKPIPRPGVEPDTQKFGGKPVSIEEMNELLGWNMN